MKKFNTKSFLWAGTLLSCMHFFQMPLFIPLKGIETQAFANSTLKEGSTAPDFSLKNQDGNNFNLAEQKGKWTVLFFYPKAETPGCTKQACSFRDSLSDIEKLNARVFGISVNSTEQQLNFKKNQKLNFNLLADEDGTVAEKYGAKIPLVNMAKRWTFILDPELTIRHIDKDVDPVLDSKKVLLKLKELQRK